MPICLPSYLDITITSDKTPAIAVPIYNFVLISKKKKKQLIFVLQSNFLFYFFNKGMITLSEFS